MPTELEALVAPVATLGSVPQLYGRLTEVMDHPRSSASDVGRVIAEDPDLTARLLRLVNSPIYGYPSRIGTVTEAIGIVGMNQLNELALGTAFIRVFSKLPADLVSMNGFWEHSIACALTARILAVLRREPNPERFFVAGLLHDVGRPILYLYRTERSRDALRRCGETGELLYAVEREVFGFDHAAVGAALLVRWKLPSLLHETVACHHVPTAARRFPLEAATVHVADHLANAVQLGSSGERLVPPLAPEAWQTVGLAPTVLPSALRQLEEQFEATVHAMLGDLRG